MHRQGLCPLLNIFVFFLLSIYRIECADSSSAMEETIIVPVAVKCNLCSEHMKDGNQFLQHAQAQHFTAYDESFLSLYNLYTPLVFSELPAEAFFTCQTCRFPVARNGHDSHINLYHVTSARSRVNDLGTETMSSVARRRGRYLGPPMRSDAYIRRFGEAIADFDEYMQNINTLQTEQSERDK